MASLFRFFTPYSNFLFFSIALISFAPSLSHILEEGSPLAPGLQALSLFAPNDGRFPCYRQPALLAASADSQTLLAFAEGRNVSAASCAPPAPVDADDSGKLGAPNPSNEVGSLMMRKSTDGGLSFGEPVAVYSGDIDFYVLVRDNSTGTVWLMLQQDSEVLVLSSNTEGDSWSTPHILNIPVPAPFTPVLQPAVGHAIQLSPSLCQAPPCKNAGRLVLPFICMNGSSHGDSELCAACHSCLIASDNHGETWEVLGIAQAGTRESQVVQVINASNPSTASLFVIERNFGSAPGTKLFARSFDGGDSFAIFGDEPALPEPVTPDWTGIVSAIERLTISTQNGGTSDKNRILFTSPNSENLRANLSVWISYDETQSWISGKSIWNSLSGYSDLARLNDTAMGVIYEAGTETFADGIFFSVLPLSWLEGTE